MKKRTFGAYIKTGIHQDKLVIRLRIEEIDREISRLLNLPEQPIQKKYRLDKLKQEYQRKLKKNLF